jgi:hypothetical protein
MSGCIVSPAAWFQRPTTRSISFKKHRPSVLKYAWPRMPAPRLRAARVGSPNRTVYLHPEIVVTNDDIASSRVISGGSPSQFGIDVQLNSAGAEKMSPIGGAAVISGAYTQADAQRIAAGMIGAPR